MKIMREIYFGNYEEDKVYKELKHEAYLRLKQKCIDEQLPEDNIYVIGVKRYEKYINEI